MTTKRVKSKVVVPGEQVCICKKGTTFRIVIAGAIGFVRYVCRACGSLQNADLIHGQRKITT